MNQSRHIFRKDIRHLWPDLSIYATLLLAACVLIPMTWDPANRFNEFLQLSSTLLKIFVLIFWIVLISRLIHDEALVGDSQFWITRPYRWTSLVNAKLLFLALFLLLPFALAQWVIVLQSGSNPLHTLSAQTIGLIQMALLLWLPFIALATVTSTIQRMLMTVVAIVLFWAAALTIVGASVGSRMSLPFAAPILAVVMAVLLVAIPLYQYATRNTSASRIALLATALIFALLIACLVESAVQYPVNAFVHLHYPVSTNGPLQLAFDPNSIPSEDIGVGEHIVNKQIIIRLPVAMQGVDVNTQLDNQNISFTIDTPGYHYTSPWRPAHLEDATLPLLIPKQALNAANGSNVHMHISEVAQRLLPGTPQTVTAAETFRIPDNGVCHLLPARSGNNVDCRYAFELASRTVIHASIVSTSCLNPGPAHPGMETLAARSPANGLDPTLDIPLQLGGAICPGSSLTFTAYHPADNFRLELDIPSLNLNRYLVR